MQVKIVDVDDTASWPDEVVEFIEEQSETADLESNPFMSAEDEILLNLLDSMHLLVYHATRLLPHEVIEIKTSGLQILTKELVTKKIQGAVAGGYLEKKVGDELLEDSKLWSDPHAHRANQICFVLGKTPFEREDSGLWPLFSIWGGESINFTKVGSKYKSLLKEIGEPAVIKAILPLTRNATMHVHPGLTTSFIKVFRNEPDASDIFWEDISIPGSCILNIVPPEDMVAIGHIN